MSLFDALGNTATTSGPVNILQQLSQLKSNPMQVLSKAGFNIPGNISNNPQAIVQHLLNTNQITPQKLNQSQMQANRLMGRH